MTGLDDKLDRLLRDDARHPINDEGFSARVMAALPAPAPMLHSWIKPALVLGSVALGSLLAALLTPADVNIMHGFVDLAQMRGLTPQAVTSIAMAAALMVSAIVLAADAD